MILYRTHGLDLVNTNDYYIVLLPLVTAMRLLFSFFISILKLKYTAMTMTMVVLLKHWLTNDSFSCNKMMQLSNK